MLCTHTARASPLSCLCPFAVSPAVKWTGSVFLANGIANPYPAEPTTNAGRAAQFAPGANWQPVQIGFLRLAHSRPQTAAVGFLLFWGLCARPAREQVTRARGHIRFPLRIQCGRDGYGGQDGLADYRHLSIGPGNRRGVNRSARCSTNICAPCSAKGWRQMGIYNEVRRLLPSEPGGRRRHAGKQRAYKTSAPF